MKESHAKILDAYQNLDRNVLYINATQLSLWSTCKEKHRKEYLLQRAPVETNIHRAFGSVIHTMAENYWAGKDYMTAFHAALKEAQVLDPRLLSSKNQTKWTQLQDSIAPITTIYYGYHGESCNNYPPLLNEEMIEWPWGEHAGIKVICNGIVDRFSNDLRLIDTKTASAVGSQWKSDLKKRLLREPQMGFYLRYLDHNMGSMKVDKIEYEIIVKPYKGSDPRIEILDVTDEVMSFQPVFVQQMDWAIREICEFYAKCKDAYPWPMSNTACINMWGECEFLPVCSGKKSLDDTKLYKIKEKREVEV